MSPDTHRNYQPLSEGKERERRERVNSSKNLVSTITYLFEGVLVEKREKFEDRKVGVKLDSLEVRVHKPVEEIATL